MNRPIYTTLILLFAIFQIQAQEDNIEQRTQKISFLESDNLIQKSVRLSFRYSDEIKKENYHNALLTLDTMYAIEAQKEPIDSEGLASFDGRYTECFLKLDILQRSLESLLYQSEDSNLDIVKPTWQYLKKNYDMSDLRRQFADGFKNMTCDGTPENPSYSITFLGHELPLNSYHLKLAKNNPNDLKRIYRKLHFYELVR